MNVPQEWKTVQLWECFSKINKKNTQKEILPVFTNSALHGIIKQKDYFDREIVSQANLNTYYLVEENDFVYNPRISKYAPAGPINKNKSGMKGLASPLYTVLRKTDKHLDELFIEYYFSSNKWVKYMVTVANYGVRSDRMNITKSDLFKMPLPYPPPKEQEKIGKILNCWDEIIKMNEKLITSKKCLRKGFIQEFLTAKKRLSKFRTPWKNVKLQDILFEHKEKSTTNEDVCSVSVHKGVVNQIKHLGRSFSAKETHNYNLVKPGDIVYTKSPTGDFPYGIIKQSKLERNVIVSPLYGVFTPKPLCLGVIIDAYYELSINTNNYLYPIIQKGAKNTINITNKTFLSGKMYLPQDVLEQKAIADLLTVSKNEIKLLERKRDVLKQLQKGLMQKLLTGKIRVKV